MNHRGTFFVYGIDYPEGIDTLGIWQIPTSPPTAFASGASEYQATAAPAAPTLWRIQLPQDLKQANAIMEAQIRQLDQQQRYLDEIEAQLDALYPSMLSPSTYAAGRRSPQSRLLDEVNRLRNQPAAFGTSDTDIDYGWLYEQCEILITRFRQVITRHGRIETRVGDDLVGLTKIDWNGDFETIWEANAPIQAMTMHVKSIRLVTASRLAILRILSIVGTGALGLAIKAAIPGGQFLLIPAVYQFVREMLEAFKKIPVEG
jgi:hypothetical protein